MQTELESQFTSPFNIEMREVGCWFDIVQGIDDLDIALGVASDYARHFGTDERVRIIDSNGKII